MPSRFPNLVLPAALVFCTFSASHAQETQVPKARPSKSARTGPAPARIKGLRRPMPITDQELVQASLRDLRNGSVVVVEDMAPGPLPFGAGKTGFFRLSNPFKLSLPPQMDPSKVISGGNTIGEVYPLGWGY